MNKLEFNNVEVPKKEFALESGDIVMDEDGGLLLVVNAGFHNNDMELLFRMVDFETGNRWEDTTYSLEDLSKYIKENELKVYRDSKININLGERIL